MLVRSTGLAARSAPHRIRLRINRSHCYLIHVKSAAANRFATPNNAFRVGVFSIARA
ncbi:hypothetical protein EMIT0158MI4_60217 [Burkholderia ambifaria]